MRRPRSPTPIPGSGPGGPLEGNRLRRAALSPVGTRASFSLPFPDRRKSKWAQAIPVKPAKSRERGVLRPRRVSFVAFRGFCCFRWQARSPAGAGRPLPASPMRAASQATGRGPPTGARSFSPRQRGPVAGCLQAPANTGGCPYRFFRLMTDQKERQASAGVFGARPEPSDPPGSKPRYDSLDQIGTTFPGSKSGSRPDFESDLEFR